MKPLLSLLLLSCCAFSQGASVPPPIIQIVSRPGLASVPLRPYSSFRAAVEVVGLTAVTGAPQTWMVEMHPTFASVEALDKALRVYSSGEPPHAMLAVLQPGWSYRPEEAIRAFTKARYVRVTIDRIQPGTEADFGQLVRLRKYTNDSINLDRPDLMYQVISGEVSDTYIMLSPIESMSVMDEGTASVPVYAAPAAEARAKAQPTVAEIIASREHVLFRVEPGASYVSDEFAAGDPSFWRPNGR